MLLPIYRKEINVFFSQITGYLVIGLFLLAVGLLLWVIPGVYNIIESGYARMDGLFSVAPWLFLFLCPAITMKSIAEERQTGSWELLFTRPVSLRSIIMGKYLAAVTLVLMALIPSLLHYAAVGYLAEPIWNVDHGAFWGSFIGLMFLASVYLAIGIFSSTLSSNQVISFLVALVISFLMFYGWELLAGFIENPSITSVISQVGINAHYASISRGVIYSSDIAYFVFVSFLFLFASERILYFMKSK